MTGRKDDEAHGLPRTTGIQGPLVTKLGEAPQWGLHALYKPKTRSIGGKNEAKLIERFFCSLLAHFYGEFLEKVRFKAQGAYNNG